MNKKQTKQRAKKMKSKNLKLRERLWPKLDPELLWDRTERAGWITIPRTMPQIFQIMDSLATKGQPVSETYFSLWCRAWDESFIKIQNPMELASEAGFGGQRAMSTWNARMKSLTELGFIDPKDGAAGKYSFVLIYNPYLVIKEKYEAGEVLESKYNVLFARAQEIGADDLED